MPGCKSKRLKAFSVAAHVSPPATEAAVLQEPLSSYTPLPFWGRKQVRDADGRLMLKNLSAEELDEWCLSEGMSTLSVNCVPSLLAEIYSPHTAVIQALAYITALDSS